MNSEFVKGKWKEIKGEIQNTWGKLTGDEIEKTRGDLKAISGLLEQKYGMAKEKASQSVSKVFSKFEEEKKSAKSSVSKSAAKAKDDLKKTM